MMTGNEVALRAEEFANALTKYEKGWWGQYPSQAEWNRILRMYPENSTYGNERYIGNSSCFFFDCVCLVKAILGGATVVHRIQYAALANNPMGDCDNKSFLRQIKANGGCAPKDAKRGYGLATENHAAIALGNGRWLDCNFIRKNGKVVQDGILIHDTGIEQFIMAGPLTGVDYSSVTPTPAPVVGDVIPMVITKIEGNIAYGQAEITPAPAPTPTPTPEIKVGSKVTIAPGAVSGGGNPTYANKPIDPKYANGTYVDTVAQINTFAGEKQALLKNLYTWVAFKYLTVVG
jgi:hypothetical protein